VDRQGTGEDRILGRTLSHYRVIDQIDAGGMGEVYRARDEHLGRDVAIKVLPPGTFRDEAARKRFRKEARALSKLNHANIATIFDFDTQDGLDFLVMEYVAGVTVSRKLNSGPLPEKEVIDLGKQLADGLAAAHSQGVIHRDLKPGNLRVTPDKRLKILDFGLAKLVFGPGGDVETESFADEPLGTLPYTSPEQLQGQTGDVRGDIWAAGVVLYEMATARHAFPETTTPRLVAQILQEAPQPPSHFNRRISPGLEGIILKCLEKEPENRYQAAKELAVDLGRLYRDRTSSATHPLPPVRPVRRRAVLMGSAVLGLIVVVLGLNIGNWRERLFPAKRLPRIESLAVLPLVNLSDDAEQEYFADGMTDQLITDLSRIGDLKVISRTSVMHFKRTSKTVPDIARELRVGTVVQGSVLRSGGRVRITVQLTDAGTDENLWGQSYEGDFADILTLQQKVATAIATQVQARLTPQGNSSRAGGRSVDVEAYQLYLEGRFYWNMRTPDGFRKAQEFFQQAIQKDPGYAEAYAGLADTFALMGDYGLLPPQEAYPKAKAAASKALELDESLAEAHTALAALENYEWNWLDAEKGYLRAIQLNPNYATAHQWYGGLLSTLGRHQQAIEEAEKAMELAPLSPRIVLDVGYSYSWARRYDEALKYCRKTLELDSDFVSAYDLLGFLYLEKNAYPDAIQAFQRAFTLSRGDEAHRAWLAYAHARAGNAAEARKILRELEKPTGQQPTSFYLIAIVYVGLGETNKALENLEKAFAGKRDKWLVFLKVEQALDPLRSEPRFKDLLRRMNLPD